MIQVKLPPPTSPNALQSALDAHIKWAVKSGSIVQMGERIARLTYYPHGLIQQAGSVSKADAALAPPQNSIRAKMKKRWGGGNAAAASSLESATEPLATNNNDSSISNESNGISMDIRSPASGFLRIIYSETIVTNAIQMHNQQSTPVNIVLAAIEPCEHPALVGSLCAVCGMDTRTSTVVVDLTNDDEKERKQERQQVRTILRREHGDSRHESSDGIENSTSGTPGSATDGVTNLTNQNQNNTSTTPSDTKITKPSNSMTSNTAKSSNVRSLSSILSGAKSTQEMQQHQKPQKRPPRNPARIVANHNTQTTSTDRNMTQMTVSGGVTLTISEAEAKSISEADAKKLRESKQLCLVLDLDHTLLHATDDYRAGRFVADEIFDSETEDAKTKPNPNKRDDVRSILLPVEMPPEQYEQYIQRQQYQMQQSNQARPALPPIPNQKLRHFVKLRPHLKEFFESIQSTYKLSVYTAGTRAYAERIAVMICRHLVGALLDEEDLTNLRVRVREKDDELKRYKNWIERQKQLKLAKERDAIANSSNGKKNGGTSKVKKKGVSFSEDAEAHDKADLSSNNETKQANVEDEQLAVRVNDSLNVSPEETTTEDVSSKRNTDGPNATYIPRKKRKVESDSLISLIAPPSKEEAPTLIETNNLQLDEKQELKDPTEERDYLRKQLQEAEALEVEATGLRRKLFGSRIVSRTDVGDLGADVKSLKRVFPCGGVMAAIVDDREDVWANAKNNESGRPGEPPDNLLLVRPYHWKPFSGYRDVNNASGVDLSTKEDGKGENKESDERENDDQLIWIADILKRLHQRFYSQSLSEIERNEQTVPDLLRAMRREILGPASQANIVFSGVIPIQQQNVQTKVRLPLVRYAEELGAKICPTVTKAVTHVVAKRDHSDKIKKARAEIPGCYIVYPSWLMECYWSITRREVEPHIMGPIPTKSQQLNNNESILLTGNDDEESKLEDEDEDDHFLDDLENEMLG